MKVVVKDGVCNAYVNDILVISANLPDYYADGYLGIGAAEGSAVAFQNTVYTANEEGTGTKPETPITGDLLLPVFFISCTVALSFVYCLRRRKAVK